MKILVISDMVSPYYWDFFNKNKLKDIDCIISCGDLHPEYLSFLATFAHGPVFYVRGNHDGMYDRKPPEGCISIEDQIEVFQGIRILGLGGSMRYHPNLTHQYSEKEMRTRVRRMKLPIMRKKGFDILVSHAPARGLGDGDDLPHQGFQIFRNMLDAYEPKYFIHGHVHLNYNSGEQRCRSYGKTTIINAFERYVFEY